MNTWLRETPRDVFIKIILFLFLPFVAMIYSLKRIHTKSSFIVFFLFSVFFGLAFTVDSLPKGEVGLDGARYRYRFEMYESANYKTYIDNLNDYLLFDEGAKDYYFDTLAFFVSRFTNNYHVFFMIIAIVFSVFMLKSLTFLTKERRLNLTLSSLILLYLFTTNQIFNINGFRFWTAAWIGVFSVFQIYRNGNYRYFILAALTPFIHGSFWVFLIVIVGAFFVKKSSKILIIIYVLSIFFSSLSVDLVRNYIDLLPPFIGRMAESYTNIEYIDEKNTAGSGFYIVGELFRFVSRLYMNLLVVLFIVNSNIIIKNPKSRTLYPFLLVWMIFVNFTMPIPSLGGRYATMAYPFIAYIWLVNFKGVKYQYVLYAMPFVFIFTFYNQIKYYLMVIDPSFLVSSPLYMLYKYL